MKAKTLIRVVCGIFITGQFGCVLAASGLYMSSVTRYTSRFHVIVTDRETGKPMSGIPVHATFRSAGGWNGEYSGLERDEAVTDENGRCTVSGRMNRIKGASAGVKNLPGYYDAGVAPTYTDSSFIKLNRWQPDGQTLHLALDRIINPMPLFIHKERLRRRAKAADTWWKAETSYSYDLLKADWLPPLGKGEVADITVTRHEHEVLGIGQSPNFYRAEAFIDRMTIRFNGDDNGIQEITPPKGTAIRIRTASLSGYQSEKKIWNKRDLNLFFTTSYSKELCQCFRIRTKRNEKGEVVEAFYGKMYGDFKIYTGNYKAAGIEFTYYLNPNPNDNNLEWDRKTNLCPNPGELFLGPYPKP